MSDEMKKDVPPVVVDGVAKWLAKLPKWAQSAVIFVMIAIGALGYKLSVADPEPQMIPVPVPVVAAGTEPQISQGLGPVRKLFVRAIRHRVSERLQKDGFNLVGGNPKPLTKEQTDKLMSRLDDETVLAGAQSVKGVAEGRFLDRLGDLLAWIVNNKEVILDIIRFLMQMLMIFADENGELDFNL